MTTINEGTQRDDLAQIKARLEAATPGPWTPQEYDDNPGDQGVPIIGGGELGSMEGHLVAYAMTLSDEAQCLKDGDFIAHAPETQAKLIAALEAVAKVAESWHAAYQYSASAYNDALDDAAYEIELTITEALQ